MQSKKRFSVFASATVLALAAAGAQAAVVLPANVVPASTFNWSFGADNSFGSADDQNKVWGEIGFSNNPTVSITNAYPRGTTGSLELRASSTASKGGLAYYPGGDGFGTLAELTKVKYDWYVASSAQAPVLRLFLSRGPYDGTNHLATLVYIPSSEASVTADTWITADVIAGAKVWQSRAGGPGGQQTKSFSDFVNDAAYKDLTVFAVEAGFGSGHPADFVGAADNVQVTGPKASVDANFEITNAASTTAVPTLSLAGLLGLVGLMASAGAVLRRRRFV